MNNNPPQKQVRKAICLGTLLFALLAIGVTWLGKNL